MIRLLGPVQLSHDDQPIQIRGHQPLALLAYLLVTGRAHTRQHLVDLCFYRADDPRASLRWSLSELRRAIGGEYLLADRQTVAFNFNSDYWLDLPAFEAGQLELYRGDFLEGLRLREAFQFEDWLFFERERLRGCYQTALAQRLAVLEAQGDEAGVVETAHRLLRLDNLKEEWYRALIRAYTRLGQREAALAQFDLCRQLLQMELGLEPGPETVALVEAIRQSHFQPAPATPFYNLPPQPTPFIGREKELVGITRLLKDPACRLLTLIGPGGIGKTRLAIQAAQSFINVAPTETPFRHGILFVPLASISSPSSVVSAIAEAANFTFYNNGPPRQQLLDYFRAKEMLLVLDNFEQLLPPSEGRTSGGAEGETEEGVAFITEILAIAPAIKLLVTSREAVNLQEAWFHPITGLAFPDPNPALILREETQAEVEAYDAVQLFGQSARRAQVGFSLAAELKNVVRICQLVEGMPLGIELATTWLKTLTCDQIAHEIEHSLDILTTRLHNIPERHRSMRAVFNGSWQLLPEAEREALKRLSVFRGGFQPQAAEPVAGASLTTLAILVEKSLLRMTARGRYHLHELLRQFAVEKLARQEEEEAATHQRHSDYYLGFLKARQKLLSGQEQPKALAEISLEIDNIRTGWAWAVAQGQIEAIDQAVEALYSFYEMRSRYQEGEEIFAQAIDHLPQAEGFHQQPKVEALLNRLTGRRGAFYFFLGDFEAANNCLLKSLNSADRPGELVFILTKLGELASGQTKPALAEERLRQSLALCREIGDPHSAAKALAALAGVKSAQFSDYAAAVELARESLALSRQLGRPDLVAQALMALAWPTHCLGGYRESETYWQESLAICQKIGNLWGVAVSLGFLGWVAHSMEGTDLNQVIDHYKKALTIYRQIGVEWVFQ